MRDNYIKGYVSYEEYLKFLLKCMAKNIFSTMILNATFMTYSIFLKMFDQYIP